MRHLKQLPDGVVALILLAVLLLGVYLFFAAIPVAAAQGDVPVAPVTDDEVNDIAKKLYCPVCENITLDTCGTAACADWRYEIRLQLEAGKTEKDIIEDFVLRFGDRVVGTPLDPLLRILSLVTPWLLIGVGLFAGGRFFMTRRHMPLPAETVEEAPARDIYQELLEKDLAG
jgi:cytochrome c-type biogenesis protein CcmH